MKLLCSLLLTCLCAGSLTPAFAATNDDDRGLRLWMKDRLAYQETSDTAPDKDQPLLQDPLSLSLEGKTYSLNNNAQDLGLAIYLAISHRQFRDALRLLPAYDRLADHDPLLVRFARAEYARDRGHYAEAIDDYRQILHRSPDFLRVRLELARTLFEDNQNREALAMFNRILADRGAELPAGTIATIRQFTGAIETRTAWTGSLSLGYVWNSNINQTPDRDAPWLSGGGLWRREDPKSSGGVSYDASLSKIFPLAGHHALQLKGTTYGDRYPHQAQFSENTSTLALLWQYSNATTRAAIGPVVEMKLSDEQRLYTGRGLRLDGDYRFTPRLMLSLNADYQKLTYKKEYETSDGERGNLYLTGIYGLTPATSLFIGADGTRVTTQVRSDDYYQTGLRAGVFSAITPDINLMVMATRRNSRFAAFNTFVGDERRDREQLYMARVSLPGYQMLTLTPFASYRFRKNHSSADGLYSYRQHEVVMGFETNF